MTIEVYSAQRRDIVAKLLGSEAHIQSWDRSAAYDLPNRWSRLKHKRAYIWMAKQYALRMGRELRSAPIWATFDYDKMAALQRVFGRDANERIITLHVPRSEALLSMYDPWLKFVLEGYCIGEESLIPEFACEHTGRTRRSTWESIFTLSSDPKDWQAAFDRIEPTWLVAIDGIPVGADSMA